MKQIDLNPSTTDLTGRDNCKTKKLAQKGNGAVTNSQDQRYKPTREEEFKALQAQLSALVEAIKVDNKPIAGRSVPVFATLRSTLETIAFNEVNGLVSETHDTIAPRSIIDSGASMSFARDFCAISHLIKHVRTLIAVEGRHTRSTHAGKLQITTGSRSVLVQAFVVPSFKDNLISVGQ